METKTHQKSKIVTVLEKVPAWAQLLITLGTLIFSFGAMYTTLQDVKYQVDLLRNVPVVNARQDADILNLTQQMAIDRTTQEQVNKSIAKLADAVTNLSSSVARLEGKLDSEDKLKRR